ncbi:hypothetical protein ACQZV8_18870 [Magnetococcales bacterium HHB-1]
MPRQILISPLIHQLLQRYPERNVLLAWDGINNEWTALGTVHAESLDLIKKILAKKGDWKPMERENEQRLIFAIPYLGHSDPLLHNYSYLEIARAPYRLIKKVSKMISLDKVRTFLSDLRYAEWRPLAILLLGLSEDREDQLYVHGNFEQRQEYGHTDNLAAWTTAYLELEGRNGLDALNSLYLSRTDRTRKEMEQIFQAIAVHTTDNLALRKLIVPMYQNMLNKNPLQAPLIVGHLIAWKNWNFVKQLSGIRQQVESSDPLGAAKIDLYLRLATGVF